MEFAGWRIWAKAHGTHNAPLFPVGEVVLCRPKKENIWDFLGVGIGEALMQGCSDVYITREFSIFLMSHLMQVFGEPFEVGRDLYIQVCGMRNSFVPMDSAGFYNGVVW